MIFTTKSKLKASIIERWNRTLKEKIWRVFTFQAEKKIKFPKNFSKILDQIIGNYNNSYHRAIKTTPNKVNEKNKIKIRHNLYGDLDDQIELKFQVGNYCRISIDKDLFDKGFKSNWENEIYIIAAAFPTMPPRFTIKDLENIEYSYKFYDYELQKVNYSQFPYNTFHILGETVKDILVEQVNSFGGKSWLNKENFFNE